MGQINDTTGIPKTESIVRLQRAQEAITFPTLKRGSDTIIEGGLLVRGHDNVARLPVFTTADASDDIDETNVLISWIHPNHTSGVRQLDVGVVGGFDPSVDLGDGRMAAVYGDGLVVGLPLTARFFNSGELAALEAGAATQNLLLVLKGQTAGAERAGEVVIGLGGNSGGVGDGLSLAAGEKNIGTTAYFEGGILYFSFNSDAKIGA